MKEDLPGVTLISFDTVDANAAQRVLRHCMKHFRFADVVLICKESPPRIAPGIRTIVPDSCQGGYEEAMRWEIRGIGNYVHTPHALFVSRDGFILNPDKWNDSWLTYDYIGAPWPRRLLQGGDPDFRVGNAGFCLRSKKFMDMTAETGRLCEFTRTPPDVFACQFMRPTFEAAGIRYAPLDVAWSFSREHNLEDRPINLTPFGFHGFVDTNKEEVKPI